MKNIYENQTHFNILATEIFDRSKNFRWSKKFVHQMNKTLIQSIEIKEDPSKIEFFA